MKTKSNKNIVITKDKEKSYVYIGEKDKDIKHKIKEGGKMKIVKGKDEGRID